MPSRLDIEAILYGEIGRTRIMLDKARADFNEAVSEVPSSLPHPDGTQRIVNARRSESLARENYMAALGEFSLFIQSGTIPARLRGDAPIPHRG
jgi:hypothetical protein